MAAETPGGPSRSTSRQSGPPPPTRSSPRASERLVLVDTGIFVSVADRREQRHDSCAELLRGRARLAVCAPVLPEAAWLIERRLGPVEEARFLRFATGARFHIIDLVAADYERAISLVETYTDLGLGFVDASIVAVAERLGINAIATLNHCDFNVVRPRHTTSFELLP